VAIQANLGLIALSVWAVDSVLRQVRKMPLPGTMKANIDV
jgi:hypothetical protein